MVFFKSSGSWIDSRSFGRWMFSASSSSVRTRLIFLFCERTAVRRAAVASEIEETASARIFCGASRVFLAAVLIASFTWRTLIAVGSG